MSYEVRFTDTALRELARLQPVTRRRIRAKAGRLAEDPRPQGATRSAGTRHLWRLRVGDHRVIYAVRDQVLLVIVVRVGSREHVYDRLDDVDA